MGYVVFVAWGFYNILFSLFDFCFSLVCCFITVSSTTAECVCYRVYFGAIKPFQGYMLYGLLPWVAPSAIIITPFQGYFLMQASA